VAHQPVEARRAPGSEWVKDHPGALEWVYDLTRRLVVRSYPLMRRISPRLTEWLLTWGEHALKGWVFNCLMCGQCILHSTGMTCPMNCPKKMRNGPCGGVRNNDHCEVIAEMRCVWVQAWERSRHMPRYGEEICALQPPLDHSLRGSSAWANMVEERTEPPPGWDWRGGTSPGEGERSER